MRLIVTLGLLIVLTGCAGGAGSGVIPSTGAIATRSQGECYTSSVQPAWIFKGPCQLVHLRAKGETVELPSYKGITARIGLPPTSARGDLVIVEAIGGAAHDIMAFKGKRFPQLPKRGGPTVLNIEAVNTYSGLTFSRGGLKFEVSTRQRPGSSCSVWLLKPDAWALIPVPVTVKDATITAKIAVGVLSAAFPHGMPAGPLFFKIACKGSSLQADDSSATVTGKLVDFATSDALAGVPVAIASSAGSSSSSSVSWSTPRSVATTASDGSFSFSASPGTYLLQIGRRGTRAVLHQVVTLIAGDNLLSAPVVPTQPGVIITAAQKAQMLRLVDLSTRNDDLTCVRTENKERSKYGLPAIVVDEYTTETAIAAAEQFANTRGSIPPLNEWTDFMTYAYTIGATSITDFSFEGINSVRHRKACAWFAKRWGFDRAVYPLGFQTATSPATVWYGADDVIATRGINAAVEAWASLPQ